MSVITISRQMGSLGNEVARLVSERLNCRIVERELINKAAKQACAPEIALAMIDELNLFGITPSNEMFQAYMNAVEVVIKELATEGNVIIVGRAGQVILSGRPDVLRVRLLAPIAIRIERIAQRRNISFQAARAQVEASDRFRRNYLKRYYHINWNDPDYYDLMINTNSITPLQASEMTCQTFLRCFSH